GQVVLRPGAGNPTVSDQAPALSGDASKLAEEPPKVGHVARKAEVVAQHEDGVEGPQPPRQPPNAGRIHVRQAADPSERHLGRRRVHANDVEAFPLKEQRVPTGTATEIEDASADEADRLPFHPRPFARWREVTVDLRPAPISVVAKSGSSGRVYLPPDWIGKRVKVIRVD